MSGPWFWSWLAWAGPHTNTATRTLTSGAISVRGLSHCGLTRTFLLTAGVNANLSTATDHPVVSRRGL